MTKPKRPANISVPGIRKALLKAREKGDTYQVFAFFKRFNEWWEVDEILEVGEHYVTFRNKCLMNDVEYMAEDTVHFHEIAMLRVGFKIEADEAAEKALEETLKLNLTEDQLNDCHDT